jgi:predicted ArsR family transcriptional regulator
VGEGPGRRPPPHRDAGMKVASLLERCGDSQRRILELLLHATDGGTVEYLVGAMGITTNAVRQHLSALERDGFVERAGTQRTRGRPEILYQLTGVGREAFPRRYGDLAESLIEEIGEVVGADALDAAMRRMGARAALQAGAERGPLSLAATAAAMRAAGYEAAVAPGAGGAPEIRAHNCVFHQLAERFPSVCEFDLAFLEAATGKAVEHRECMVRGGRTCRFGFRAAR